MKKNTILKKLAVLAFSAAMVFGISMISQASTLTDAISSVDLYFSYDLASGMTKDDVYVSSSTDGISSVTVSSITNTTSGSRPTVKVTVKADTSDGYYFSSDDSSSWKTSSAFDLSGDTTTYSSSSRSSNSSVTLTVRLAKIGSTSTDDLSIDSVSWTDDSSADVSWSDAYDATKYYVKLLRGSTIKQSFETTNTSYDFSSYITSTGTYYVKVRAYNSGTYGEWAESDELYVDSDLLSSIESNSSSSSNSSSGPGTTSSSSSGAWLKDSTGWWYCNADKTYTTNNWQQINNSWYFFNSSGYMVTGWLKSPASGNWYYMSTTSDSTLGRMMTNYWTPDNYYVGSDGIWVQNKTR